MTMTITTPNPDFAVISTQHNLFESNEFVHDSNIHYQSILLLLQTQIIPGFMLLLAGVRDRFPLSVDGTQLTIPPLFLPPTHCCGTQDHTILATNIIGITITTVNDQVKVLKPSRYSFPSNYDSHLLLYFLIQPHSLVYCSR